MLLRLAVAFLIAAGTAEAGPLYSTLDSFRLNVEGGFPNEGLVEDARGKLYGTTFSGGPNGAGSVFELVPPAPPRTKWQAVVLWSFSGPDGQGPVSRLLLDTTGTLSGVTTTRGPRGFGTVFRLSPPASGHSQWRLRTVWAFSSYQDGGNPVGSLIADAGGSLYGNTTIGGGSSITNYQGTIYRLTPRHGGGYWKFTRLYRFSPNNGARGGSSPEGALLLDKTGALYGTTPEGGAGRCGTVFKLTPPNNGSGAWTHQVLHEFANQNNGLGPFSGLVADGSGQLYGTTSGDCGSNNEYGPAVVYRLKPPQTGQANWTYTVLHRFADKEGQLLVGALTPDGGGGFYGEAEGGGPDGQGAVYRISPPGNGGQSWSVANVYAFPAPDGAANPVGEILFSTDGVLYGTTFTGGGGDMVGTAFSVKP